MEASDIYIRSVLNQLREEKVKQQLTCEEIHNLVEDMGFQINIKTVKRVMKPDGTDTNFRLSTLRNIALAMGTDLENKDANTSLTLELERMQSDLEHLDESNEEKRELIESLLERIKGFEERLQIKNVRIDDKNAEIKELHKQNKTLRHLAAALVTMLFAYAAAHAYDQIKIKELTSQ